MVLPAALLAALAWVCPAMSELPADSPPATSTAVGSDMQAIELILLSKPELKSHFAALRAKPFIEIAKPLAAAGEPVMWVGLGDASGSKLGQAELEQPDAQSTSPMLSYYIPGPSNADPQPLRLDISRDVP